MLYLIKFNEAITVLGTAEMYFTFDAICCRKHIAFSFQHLFAYRNKNLNDMFHENYIFIRSSPALIFRFLFIPWSFYF